MARYNNRGPALEDADNRAFNAMNKVTTGAPDRMFKDDRVFTESVYNTNATEDQRRGYDRKAFSIIHEVFEADKKRNPKLRNWDINRYLSNLHNSYLEDIIMSEDHPINISGETRPGYANLLQDVYEGDVDQLKLSAWNLMQDKPTKDRSNIPAGEGY